MLQHISCQPSSYLDFTWYKDQEEEWHLNFQGAVDAHNILDGVIPEVILNYCTFK